jgi:hypothetical protein
VAALAVTWVLAAYIVVPAAWRRYILNHPGLSEDMPRITKDADGRSADPLNLALIGTQEEIITIFARAGWQPADAITLKSCAKITSATVFKKAYDKAPVSNLFLWGRKQDLAFQKAVPKNPHQRHHVRFWKSVEEDSDGRPLWVGAATFDKSVGVNKATGQPTHHIDKNVDWERDTLIADLRNTGLLVQVETLEDFHDTKHGKNGGLDPWETDGHLVIGYIAAPRILGLVSPPIDDNEDVCFPPAYWQRCFDHPALDKLPQKIASTKRHTGGDPLNVALIGTHKELLAIMEKAAWKLVEKIEGESWHDLYFCDRRHDLAFQIAEGRERRHVRFWKSPEVDDEGRPLWIGTAAYHTKVVAQPKAAQIAYHLDPKIDRERDYLFADLAKTNMLAAPSRIEDFHPAEHRHGKNAAGHPWETDGHLTIGLIRMPEE